MSNESNTPSAAKKDHPVVTLLKGMAMGTADIIPGVSGGTMAFILGIYDRLLGIIRDFNMDLYALYRTEGKAAAFKKLQPEFVFPLLAGIVLAIIVMVKVVGLPELLRTHPEPVYGAFFGLIAGSVLVLLFGDLPKAEKHVFWDVLEFVAGLAFGLFIVTLVPADTPDATWFYFICGVLAISAMLMPGVSGSFVLLILGQYAAVLDAIASLDGWVLLPFAFGCGIGLGLFARVISWMLEKHRRRMILTICGVLTGTLYAIWPFQNRVYDVVREKERLISTTPIMPESLEHFDTQLSIGLAFSGFVLVLLMGWLGRKKI